jgi:hypothetical protein
MLWNKRVLSFGMDCATFCIAICVDYLHAHSDGKVKIRLLGAIKVFL